MTERYDAVDPQVPLLLFPLRLETRSEQIDGDHWDLRMRVYPDDVSISTVNRELSAEEVEAAKAWWRARWASPVAQTDTGTPTDRSRPLARPRRGRRPRPGAVGGGGDAPDQPGRARHGRPGVPRPADRVGSAAPRAVLMPDALRAVIVQAGTTVSREGNPIPAAGVPTGSAGGDVEALARSLAAITNDAVEADDPLAWITDFAAAGGGRPGHPGAGFRTGWRRSSG